MHLLSSWPVVDVTVTENDPVDVTSSTTSAI